MDEFASRHYPVQENMRFQRRSWLVERLGWLVLTAIAAVGLTGALGNGPASWARASGGALIVTYERFERATRTSSFVFDLAPGPGGERTLHLSAPFQRDFELTSIQPPPLRSRTEKGGMALTFAAPAGAPGRVVIWAHARSYGLSRIAASADGGPSAAFWVFAYP
jgi:hypothetical protein